MEITSPSFVGFVAGVVIAFHISPSRIYRLALLTLANIIFIGTYISELREIVPLLSFLLLGYGAIGLVRRHRSGIAAMIGISSILMTYLYLKRVAIFGDLYTLKFSYLTVGLSYILFRVIHLIIDIRSGDITEPIKPLAFFDYTCNFLTFVSGPIQLYQKYVGQLPNQGKEILNADFVFAALRRIISGYVKVLIISGIADYLFLRISGDILKPDVTYASGGLIAEYGLCAAIYTIYLYFNFSGYMDIVIGVGRLLSQDLPENFNKPFLASSFLEFWTRWHMTLSQWFRTYLFNPLLSLLIDRVPQPALGPYLGVTALFITFFVMGIWHGTTTVFVMYGLLMGAGAGVNKLWQVIIVNRLGREGYRALGERSLYIYACRGLTCGFFTIGITCLWVNIDQLSALWGALGPAGAASALLLIAAACGIAMFLQDSVVIRARRWFAWAAVLSQRGVFGNFWSAAQILVILMVSTFFHKAPDFVYRTF